MSQKGRRASKRPRGRELTVRIARTIYSRRPQGVSVRQLHVWHRIAVSTVYRHLGILRHQGFITQPRRGARFFYLPPPRRPRKPRKRRAPPKPGPPGPPPIQDEHDRLVAQQDSEGKIEHVEECYRRRLREGKDTAYSVRIKILEISHLSLSEAEKAHILRHLGI